jgi:hypothetical protein
VPPATAKSVIPRVAVLHSSTAIVCAVSSRAETARRAICALPWPKDLSVARPWIESRKSAAKARCARERSRLAPPSRLWNAPGPISAASAKPISTSATGQSIAAAAAKTSSAVTAATASWGR